MQIRTRLTVQFAVLTAFTLGMAFIAVYFFSSKYRQEDFYERLLSKASNTANLLIEVDEIDAELLSKIERANPSSLPGEAITIYNYQDEVVFNSGVDEVAEPDLELLNRVRLDKEIRYRKNGKEAVGFLFTGRYNRFVVLAEAMDVYGLKKVRNLRVVLILVFFAGLLLLILSGWFYSGRALRPISGVVKEVEGISITSLDKRVNIGNGQDEIAQLAITFNQMLDRLENAFKVQKNFIANASHELRTPLTAITGQLEVLLLKDRSPEEYQTTVSSVLEDMKQLNLTSNRLLLLAQTSSESGETVFEPLRIDEIIWAVRTDVLKRNPDFHVQVLLPSDEDEFEQLFVNGNELLLRTCFLNLVENGCKYSENHTCTIRVKGARDSEIEVVVSDSGIGISQDDLPRIFEPFHRGKNALGFKGHGLGLSLVDRIVRLHNGSIGVQSEQGTGTTFFLRMPALKL